MKRIGIAGATLAVAAGLVGAVAAPASAAGPPPGQGLVDFGTWDCGALGTVDLVGPRPPKAASVYTATTGEHIISFSLTVRDNVEGEVIFSKTSGEKSGLTTTPVTCTQHVVDVGIDFTLTLQGGVAPPQ